MSTTNDMPEWEFYLTTTEAKALLHAGRTLLTSWQRNHTPSTQQTRLQFELSSALDTFSGQVSTVLYSDKS